MPQMTRVFPFAATAHQHKQETFGRKSAIARQPDFSALWQSDVLK
jgi:hypothetical protein